MPRPKKTPKFRMRKMPKKPVRKSIPYWLCVGANVQELLDEAASKGVTDPKQIKFKPDWDGVEPYIMEEEALGDYQRRLDAWEVKMVAYQKWLLDNRDEVEKHIKEEKAKEEAKKKAISAKQKAIIKRAMKNLSADDWRSVANEFGVEQEEE